MTSSVKVHIHKIIIVHATDYRHVLLIAWIIGEIQTIAKKLHMTSHLYHAYLFCVTPYVKRN